MLVRDPSMLKLRIVFWRRGHKSFWKGFECTGLQTSISASWLRTTPTPVHMKETPLFNKILAEFFGTFWLTFGGCGSAVLAAKFLATEGQTPINLGIGLVGVSLAFGLTVLTMAYAVGHVSGGHFNPAVSVGLVVARRFPASQLLPYMGAQVIGAIAGAGALYLIASGKADFSLAGGFASNGYGEHSPAGYNLLSALVAEVLLTFFFLFIILGATDARAPQGFAPIAIGLGLTLIHLIGIPVTNLSVNPARSTGPAVFVGGWALQQLWLFWLAPIVGAAAAGILYPIVSGSRGTRLVDTQSQPSVDPAAPASPIGERAT